MAGRFFTDWAMRDAPVQQMKIQLVIQRNLLNLSEDSESFGVWATARLSVMEAPLRRGRSKKMGLPPA